MEQDVNVKNWVDCWKSSNKIFRRKTSNRSDREQAESWNSHWSRPADERALRPNRRRKKNRMNEVFAFLDKAGCKVDGARVLDIGCGPGATSIPFAKAGAKVTSFDISSVALKRLEMNADCEGVSIETIEGSWWTADIDEFGLRKKFDLVFVTTTPAVKDAEGFDRMNGCSRGFCYFGHGIRGGGTRGTEMFLSTVLHKDTPRTGGNAMSWFIAGFMYLYLQGYRPVVRINHARRKTETPWEAAAERMIKSLERTKKYTKTDTDKIREYYRTTSVEGKCHSVSEGYSGMMAWNVNR